MQQVRVRVHHSADMPHGLPAVWAGRDCPEGVCVDLWLAEGMPAEQADRWRCAAVRDSMPGVNFDAFTVTDVAAPVTLVAAG